MIDKTEKNREKKKMKKGEKRRRKPLVPGLYCRDFLPPWDSKDDFEQLHQALCAEFRPCGAAENETVLDLTNAFWLKRTLWRMRQATLMSDPFMSDIRDTGCRSWRGIRKQLRAQASESKSFRNLAEDTVAELGYEMQRLQKGMREAADAQQVKNAEEKMAAYIRLLAERAAPALLLVSKFPNAEQAFDKAYEPGTIEKLARLEATLDARIAKILARLVGLKEFKKTPAGGGGAGGAPQLALESRIGPIDLAAVKR